MNEPTAGRVVRFSLPVVAGSLLLMGSQFLIVAVMGHADGPALFVRSVYAPVAFLYLALTTGLSVAAQVGSAQCIGRGEAAQSAGIFGTTTRLGLAACASLGLVLAVLAVPLAHLLSVPAADRSTFVRFLLLMTLVVPLGFVAELGTGVLRGAGYSGRALELTLTSVVITGSGVVLLGIVAGLGLWAVPAASALGGGAELLLGVLLLRRHGLLGWERWRAGDRAARLLARAVAVPVGASYALLFVVNLFLLLIVSPSGPAAVAGFTLGYTLQAVVIVPAVGFGSAVAILVNQHAAAGQPCLVRLALRNGFGVVAACYVVLTLALVLVGGRLVEVLSDDPAVVEEARTFMATVGPTFGCTALVLFLLTLLEQTGRGAFAVTLNLLYFAAMIGAGAWLASRWDSADGLYQVMAISAVAGLLTGAPIAWAIFVRNPMRLPEVRAPAAPVGAASPPLQADPDPDPDDGMVIRLNGRGES